MWRKGLVTFLVGLHILPLSVLRSIDPNDVPSPTPSEIRIPSTVVTPTEVNGLSIQDEVYADLAMQHELGDVSVYYFDDNPKNTVSINPDKNWDPASTIKLYVAMYAFDQVSHGKISLDQKIVIDAKNVVPSQSFANGYQPLSAGDSASIYELLDRMITQSGNVSYNTLIDVLGRKEVTKYIHDLGLTNSGIGAKLNLDANQEAIDAGSAGFGPNLVTADDYAKAFILISGGRIPGSTDLFNMLARQKFNSMIPALLPKDVIVAHKTGELDPYYHDGGIIVSANRKYVLSVFSDLGSPDVVAHISQLVYTNNVNIVGDNSASGVNNSRSVVPNAPIDPLVSESLSPETTSVLAASINNISVPKVAASDIGIKASDLANTLTKNELPPVIIPTNSPFHFLVSLGEQIRVVTNPIPSLRIRYQTQNIQQDLAEANNLIANKKANEANRILDRINNDLIRIASDPATAGNKTLQNSIDAISETRFSILGDEVKNTNDASQKIEIIKNIASQASDTIVNIKPFVAEGTKQNTLAQTPVVGQVISTAVNSVTLKTSDGNTVSTPLDTTIKTRDAGSSEAQTASPSDIQVGSTIAVAGSFVLTNIAPDSANPKPVTVLKVNNDTNTLVIEGTDGKPQQIDLTPGTVIKGADTSVSLDEINPGDVIVVHGEALPATPSASIVEPSGTPIPAGTPLPNGQTSQPSNNLTLPTTQGPINQTPTPLPTPVPTKATTPTSTPKATPTATPVPVIKGNVIQVIQAPVPTKTPAPTPAPKATPVPAPTKAPTPIPAK